MNNEGNAGDPGGKIINFPGRGVFAQATAATAADDATPVDLFLRGYPNDKTREAHKNALKDLERFIGRDPWTATRQEMREYLASKASGGHRRHLYSAFHKFFNDCIHVFEVIRSNPLSGIKKPREQRRVIFALTATEFEALVAVCDRKTAIGLRDLCIILLLQDAGLRPEEIGNLGPGDIKTKQGGVLVRGKNGDERFVNTLGVVTQRALFLYLPTRKDQTRLFETERGKAFDKNSVGLMLKRRFEDAGVRQGDDDRVFPYLFRYSFAKRFIKGGGDIDELRSLLGHEDFRTTHRYIKKAVLIDEEKLPPGRSAVDRMSTVIKALARLAVARRAPPVARRRWFRKPSSRR